MGGKNTANLIPEGGSELQMQVWTKLWPRRLLHVPTMTSFERQNGKIYGGCKEPAFNVLSYTWGRWEVADGPSLPVKGVTWKIPSIACSCFTVENFERVLNVAAGKEEFVWLDVACIDQATYDIKMEEVGRQAGIFHMSSNQFVWLHSLGDETFQDVVQSITRSDDDLAPAFEVFVEEVHNAPVDYMDYISKCLLQQSWAEHFKTALSTLVADPWYSSLWTLQESQLASEAVLLSRTGQVVEYPGLIGVDYGTVITNCGNAEWRIVKALNSIPFLERAPAAQVQSLREVLRLIDKLDLTTHEQPMTLYSAAGRRTCQEPLDRVYAIMQVFDFKLGASRDPSRTYTLSDLELEFAVALNERSPINAQLSTHLEIATPGRSWVVDQSCELPTIFNWDDVVPQSHCSIGLDRRGNAFFRGKGCQFSPLAQQWLAFRASDVKGGGFWHFKKAVQIIVLDRSQFNVNYVEARFLHASSEPATSDVHRELVEVLLTWHGESLRVLKLGKFIATFGESMGDDTASDHEECSENNEDATAGLVVRKVVHDGETRWERVGVVVWRALEAIGDNTIFAETRVLLC
jgi:hypothetical protein